MCKWHPWHVCGACCLPAQPQAPTSGAPSTCAALSPLPAVPSACKAAQHGEGRQPKTTPGGLFLRLMVLEEVDFRRQRRKAALRAGVGRARGHSSTSPCLAPRQTWPEGGAKTLLGAWFGAGLWGGCWLWGQPQGAPLPPSLSCGDSLLSRSGLSLPCGFRYWWQLFRAIYFTKYLLSHWGRD